MNQWNVDRGDERNLGSRSAHNEQEATGGDVRCRECQAIVAGKGKFCPDCGARTQEVCFACGSLSSPGGKFCADCGADLIDGLETQVNLFEEKLSEARRLLKGSCRGRAVELLQPLVGAKHPILARYGSEARELLRQATVAEAQEKKDAKRLQTQALAAVERLEYHQALQLLEEIAAACRSETVEGAIAEVRTIVNEIDRLAAEISTQSVRKDPPVLLAKVERLLELQPAHAAARQAGERFREHAHRRARLYLTQDEHDRALEILELVPKLVANAETQELLHHAHEFGWLQWDLLHAPTVDRTLVDVGRRLCKIAPHHAKFKELHERLSRFASRHPEDRVLPAARWMPPPKETPWGCPVEWLTGFGETEVAETADRATVERFAGSLFPAFGLALQGLGKASLGINFLKDRKRRALDGLLQTRWAWGLDLSPGGLKALRLDVRKTDQQIVIGACELIEHRKPLGEAGSPEEREQLITETLEVFRKRGHKKLGSLCVCLPDVHFISRRVKIPPANARKLADAVEYEARSHFAQLPMDVVWGYHPLEAIDEESPHRERPVLLVALKESMLRESLDVLRASKLKVDQVQVDWLATVNALIHLGHLSPPETMSESRSESNPPDVVGVLDIGCETATLLIQGPGILDARPIHVGGLAFTRALAREFKLSLADAERLKRDPRSLELLSQFHETLQSTLEDVVRDMKKGLDSLAREDKQLRVCRLLAVGGGMRLHGLWRHLLYGR